MTRAVLTVLGHCLNESEAQDLASQLPEPLGEVVSTREGEATDPCCGVEEFQRRAARLLNSDTQAATRAVRAVLSTLGEAMSEKTLTQLLAPLQTGYAWLFGKDDLA